MENNFFINKKFGIFFTVCFGLLTLSVFYNFMIQPIGESVATKIGNARVKQEEKKRAENEITVGEEFKLADGRKLRVKSVTLNDFDLDVKTRHRTIAFSINSEGELPKEIRESMYLEREEGSVVRSTLGGNPSTGEYEFEFNSETNRIYFLVFDDKTKVKLVPFSY